MAAPIRTMVFAGVMIMIYTWALIGFIGSYQISNNIPLNATLKQQYEAVIGNSSNGGIFGALGNLTSQGKTQSQQLGGLNSLNSIGMVAQFFRTVPAIYSTLAYFILSPFESILGTQLSVTANDLLFLAIIIIVLSILSAIFLFPI